MGIKGAHSLTHSVSKVTIGELYQIALARKKLYNKLNNQTATPNNHSIELKPTIDIDAS